MNNTSKLVDLKCLLLSILLCNVSFVDFYFSNLEWVSCFNLLMLVLFLLSFYFSFMQIAFFFLPLCLGIIFLYTSVFFINRFDVIELNFSSFFGRLEKPSFNLLGIILIVSFGVLLTGTEILNSSRNNSSLFI